MSLVAKVESADVLTEVLSALGIAGQVFCRSELSAPWAMALPPGRFAHFHVLERGCGWIRLASGDLVLLPHGGGHVLGDRPETPAVPLDRLLKESRPEHPVIRHGGGGAATHLICGSFQFENPTESPLLSLLPPLIRIRGEGCQAEEWLTATLRLLALEAREARPGAKAVVSRLTEVLFVQALRAWMASRPAGEGGWLGALRDPQIGAALGLMHRAPERDWSVAELAREVAMSRSPFAARFATLVGKPPLAYLTRWRMHRAARLLRSDSLSVGEVANRVGYESAAAFSKAFKRRFGVALGVYRRAAGPGAS